MKNEQIICPECGGTLEFWKEYNVVKSHAISKIGVLSQVVKKTPLEFMVGMEGLQCRKCGWVLNCVEEMDRCEKYPHLMEWIDSHIDELTEF